MFHVSFCIVFISSILYICVWKKVSNPFSLFYIMYDVKKNVHSVILAENIISICRGFYL